MKRVFFSVFAGAVISSAAGQTTTPLQLPFSEKFDQDEFDPAWTKIESAGCAVKIDDGELRIRSVPGGQAHIQRPVSEDKITVTAKANFDSSIYVVWDKDNWVSLGKLSPTPFGRFCTTLTVDGETSVTQHRGINYGSMHLQRIELGNDLVRFLYSQPDKPNYTALRTIRRSGKFAGTPTLVSFGTRYTSNPGPYGDPATLDTGSTSTKDRGETALDDIEIKKTSPAALALTPDEKRYMDKPRPEPVSELLTASAEDPTFEQVAAVYPEMRDAREVVGVPYHPLDIGIDWVGRFDVSPWAPAAAWLEFGEPGKPFAESPKDIASRELYDRSIPIVTLKKEQNGIKTALTAMGYTEDFSPDADLYAYGHVSMEANQGVHLPEKLALVGQENKRIEWQPELTNRSQMDFYFKYKHPEPETAVEVSKEEFEAVQADVVNRWKELLGKASRITTPDQRTNEMYKALLAYSMLNTDKVKGHLEPHDGTGFYDSCFGYSVSMYAMACDMYGLHDYAEQIHDMQFSFQKEDGSYVQDCGLVDIGTLLTAVPRHYEITRRKDWLERVTPNIIKGCEWLLAQRAKAPKEGMTKGLIEFRPYNDYPQPTFNYVGNTFVCKALEECAKVLPVVGKDAEAAKYAEEAKRFRQEIYDSMEASKFQKNDMTILPIEPDTQRLLKLNDYTGGEYYGLTASQMFETEFFKKDDAQKQLYIDMLEQRGGLIAGMCEFQEGVDHAYTYGYWMEMLNRNEPRKAILGHLASMAYAMTRGTYSPVEVTMIKTGENHYTLPHLYSMTQHLRLLRNMLLREDEKTLVLGQAIPRQWLDPGKKTEVVDAPTRFGPVSYTVESPDSKTVNIRLTPPSVNPPEQIKIYVRHPSMTPITAATLDTGEEVRVDGQSLVLAGNARPGTLTVKFE